MNLQDRIAEVLYPVVHPPKWDDHVARWVADALMPVIAAELDARWEEGRQNGEARAAEMAMDLQHAERENRRLVEELKKAKGE